MKAIEARVQAQQTNPVIESFYAAGTVQSRRRYKDGSLHNGPHGEPAILEYNQRSIVVREANYVEGHLQDRPDGAPALRIFDDEGQEQYRAHYNHGALVREVFSGE